ncbi:MAG: CPBP family intramembrane glutamic endopeptidase [Acidobacteriota bacterium]
MAQDPLTIATFALLAAAVAALWAPPRRLWIAFLILASGCGLASGWLSWPGLVAMAVLAAASWQSQRGDTPRRRLAGSLVVVALGGALMLHVVPGFAGWLVAPDVRLSPGSQSFSLFLNFDKPLIGLFLLAAGGSLLTTLEGWRRILPWTLGMLAVAIAVVLVGTFLLGYASWDPKLPALFALWAPRNLLFTCVAEEAYFRLLIQGGLERALGRFRWGARAAWVVASVLFGVAHVGGGWQFVLLATLAGGAYGLAYQRTRAIEASILVHLGLNSLHFLLFNYPAAA